MTVSSRNLPWRLAASAVVIMLLAAGRVSAANELVNGGFESPDVFGGELADADSPWENFGAPDTRFTTGVVARTGLQSLKTFGPFDFIGGGTGASQTIPATENTPYQAEIFAQHISGEALEGNNFGVFKIEFYDANMALVAGLDEPAGTPLLGYNFFESAFINSDTPLDTWTQLDASGFSPPGTEFATALFVQVQLGDGLGNFTGGSIYWDDALVMAQTPGDFNLDGRVDGVDFVQWQRGEAPDGGSPFELGIWEANFGTATSRPASTSIPEPTAALLSVLAVALVCARRRQGIVRIS